MKQLNRKSRSALSCVGMVILGVILVIVGTILQNHFKLGAAVCNTFDNTSTGCVTNSSAFSAGQIIDSIGKFLVIGGLASGGLLMLSNILDNRPKAASQQPAAGPTTTMPGTSPASNARSGNPMISQPQLVSNEETNW